MAGTRSTRPGSSGRTNLTRPGRPSASRIRAVRFDHVAIAVRDVERTAAWYRRMFGFRNGTRWRPEPLMIRLGATCFALFRGRPRTVARSVVRHGLRHVAFHVARRDFLPALSRLRAEGLPVRGPVDHGSALSLYTRDPNGYELEVTTPKGRRSPS